MGTNSPSPESSDAGSEKNRLAAAARHGLPENATWDQIADARRKKINEVLGQ